MFDRLLDSWHRFRARWRIRSDAIENLQAQLVRERHAAQWEIQKRDDEIAAKDAGVACLTEMLELERAWVAKLTAQFSVEQALAEARGRER